MSAEVIPQRLTELEDVIERGLSTFVEVGDALLEIRDSRLYRDTHATFETYCRERWGMSKVRATQLIQATAVVGALAAWSQDIGTDYDGARPLVTMVTNERVARELVPVMRTDPASMAAVMVEVVARAERDQTPVTAATVRSVVRDRMRSEAALAEQELQEATANWTPEKRAEWAPERMRQKGELMRLTGDLSALPEPAAFVHDFPDLPARVIDQAEAAHAWLSDFLTEWRHTHGN